MGICVLRNDYEIKLKGGELGAEALLEKRLEEKGSGFHVRSNTIEKVEKTLAE